MAARSRVTLTSKDLSVKGVLMCFAFYWYLVGSGRKKKETNKQKTSEVSLPQYFTRMAEQYAFWPRNRRWAWAWPLPQRS